MAAQVDAQHGVPFLGRAGDEHPVADEAGVVDHGVQVAKGVERRLDHALTALDLGDVVGVGDGPAAGGDDLIDHGLGRADRLTGLAVGADAQVVDDDFRPLGRQSQGVGPAQPAARARDDDHAAFTDTEHGRFPHRRSMIVTLA
ncbi:hypothetical protein D3C80_1082770 [compost metagenome]